MLQGLQDVHVVSLVEIIGMFCIGHRIEIDAGQVRLEGVGNAVDVFTKDNSFDAFLVMGFRIFFFFILPLPGSDGAVGSWFCSAHEDAFFISPDHFSASEALQVELL